MFFKWFIMVINGLKEVLNIIIIIKLSLIKFKGEKF